MIPLLTFLFRIEFIPGVLFRSLHHLLLLQTIMYVFFCTCANYQDQTSVNFGLCKARIKFYVNYNKIDRYFVMKLNYHLNRIIIID